MKSTYEEVSAELDILWNLLWDCMSVITKDNRSALATKRTRKIETSQAFVQLQDELLFKHGWTIAEWETENDRRVALNLQKEKSTE